MIRKAAESPKFVVLVKLILIFFLFLSLSKVLGPSYGPIVFFVYLAISLSPFMPSQFFIQRVSISAILIIGLSPIYLIFRGFITKVPLNSWDLQIYFTAFLMGTLVVSFAFKGSSSFDSYLQKLNKKNHLAAAFSGLIFVLIAEAYLLSKSLGHAVAWIASGDSKNHLVNGVDVIRYGYLDISLFLTQPVSAPSYLALNLSQSGQHLNTQSELLGYQMQVYAFVWILLIGLVGLVFAATLETIWNIVQKQNKFIPLHMIVIVSIIPTFSVVLGPSIRDGFFTAIFGISSVAILITWFLEIYPKNQFTLELIVAGLFLLGVSVMAWMFVAPFTLLLFLFGLRTHLKNVRKSKAAIDPLFIMVLLAVASAVHFSAIGQSFIYKAKLALTSTGTVSATDPNLYFSAILGLMLVGIVLQGRGKKLSEMFFAISILSILALLGFKYFSNLNFDSWNYYLLKYQWMMFVSLFGLIVSVLFIGIYILLTGSNKNRYLASFTLTILIFFASEAMVSSNKVWQKIWLGWENPRSSTINTLLEQDIDRKNPTMFFHYGYAGDAMLANFWLTAFSDPVEPLKGWNYTIDTSGDVQQICDVNAYYPALTIVTSDTALERLISETCPLEEFNLILKPSLF
jgi:hypothetical protein